MFNTAPIRIAFIMLYFLACTACGSPEEPVDESENSAGDINFIGGGTQGPEIAKTDEAYHSPTLSTPPQPTYIPWKPSIEQAIDSAQKNPDKMIIVWFRNSDCSECIDMERNVFNDPDVIALTRKWLFVKVDTDRMSEREEDCLSRSEPPVLVFLSKDGLEAHRYNGAVTSEEFITMLKTWR